MQYGWLTCESSADLRLGQWRPVTWVERLTNLSVSLTRETKSEETRFSRRPTWKTTDLQMRWGNTAS